MAYTMDTILQSIHKDWKPFFIKNKEELEKILEQVNNYSKQKNIFPFPENVFESLKYFGPHDIKLVLLGQDPYIGSETIDNNLVPQAHGLSFSVPDSHKKIPPSLKNIFKEIGIDSKKGSLLRWVTDEKILLLNSALTVMEGESNSHQHLWTPFTDKLITWISETNSNEFGTIFLLMGNYAIKKGKLVDGTKHKIFTCAHPSPLSARHFFGCNVFKDINTYLKEKNMVPINWNV
jgi:uracil-DNA glycosylase